MILFFLSLSPLNYWFFGCLRIWTYYQYMFYVVLTIETAKITPNTGLLSPWINILILFLFCRLWRQSLSYQQDASGFPGGPTQIQHRILASMVLILNLFNVHGFRLSWKSFLPILPQNSHLTLLFSETVPSSKRQEVLHNTLSSRLEKRLKWAEIFCSVERSTRTQNCELSWDSPGLFPHFFPRLHRVTFLCKWFSELDMLMLKCYIWKN